MTPSYHWKVADPFQKPDGTPLANRPAQSYWSASEDVLGHRDFFTSVENWVDKLEPFAAFLSEIVVTGGSITLIVHLSGARNIGDVINFDYLARMASLKITLGVEVFPDYG